MRSNVKYVTLIVERRDLGLKFLNVSTSILQDRAFVLVRARDHLCDIFYALVDDLTATSFDYASLADASCILSDTAYLPCGCLFSVGAKHSTLLLAYSVVIGEHQRWIDLPDSSDGEAHLVAYQRSDLQSQQIRQHDQRRLVPDTKIAVAVVQLAPFANCRLV